MARLYGLNRSSLYEAIEKGRLSCGFNGRGQREIDLSEMRRVYGEPAGDAQQSAPWVAAPNNAELLGRLDALTHLVEQQSQQIGELRREVAELRTLPPPKSEKNQEPADGLAIRSLSDVLARFESRSR